jgi:hypothetical protein
LGEGVTSIVSPGCGDKAALARAEKLTIPIFANIATIDDHNAIVTICCINSEGFVRGTPGSKYDLLQAHFLPRFNFRVAL